MASKHYHIKLNFESDREVIDRIESKENKNDYIRGLVLSDIAADILRSGIKLEDVKDAFNGGETHAVHEPVTRDVESFDQDPEEIRNHERVDFYNDHCPALNNPDPNINNCDDCEYKVHYTDVDGIVKAECSLEDEWKKHWNHVLYKAVGGADRDYPAEFKGLKKDDSNASNALDNDIKKGEPDNG